MSKPKSKEPGVNKYITNVLPRLGDVMDWARAGADLKEIADKLEVSYSAFRSWVKKGSEGEERYAPLAIILAQAQEAPNREVEAALYKRSIGYTATETVKETRKDADGKVTGTVTKHFQRDVPPDPTSIMFLLTNRLPERWRKAPEGGKSEGEGSTGVVEMPAVKQLTPPKDG